MPCFCRPNDRQLLDSTAKMLENYIRFFDKGEITSYDDFRSCSDGKT